MYIYGAVAARTFTTERCMQLLVYFNGEKCFWLKRVPRLRDFGDIRQFPDPECHSHHPSSFKHDRASDCSHLILLFSTIDISNTSTSWRTTEKCDPTRL